MIAAEAPESGECEIVRGCCGDYNIPKSGLNITPNEIVRGCYSVLLQMFHRVEHLQTLPLSRMRAIAV